MPQRDRDRRNPRSRCRRRSSAPCCPTPTRPERVTRPSRATPPATLEDAPAWGSVLTFYSYKGGVGRSMTLANVAALMAKRGRRVLIVDWDLEAPGIEKFFEPHAMTGNRTRTPGILDLILANARGERLDWRSCVLTSKPFLEGETVHIISAGRLTPEYAESVQRLNWDEQFVKHDLGGYLNALRQEWARVYDFVLVDSRTGINDVGGICTVILPDIIVLLFTTSQQSLDGIVDVMARARVAHAQLPVDRGRLVGLPLPSRDESRNWAPLAREWRAKFESALGSLYREWIPKEVSPGDVINKLYIPYVSEWSFGERLPVVENEDEMSDPRSISHAYDRLANLITNRLDWYGLERGGDATALAEALSRAARSDARRVRWMQVGTALAVVFALVVVAAGLLQQRASSRRQRAAAILAAANAATDPLEATLLAAELAGLPQPNGGQEVLFRIAMKPTPRLAVDLAIDAYNAASGLAVSSTGSLAVASVGNSPLLWWVDGRSDPAIFRDSSASMRILLNADAMGFHPDGNQLAVGYADQSVTILRRAQPQRRLRQGRGIGMVVKAEFNALGDAVLGLTNAGEAWVWRVREDSVRLIGQARLIDAASFSPDGRRVALFHQSGQIEVIEIATGASSGGLRGAPFATEVAIAPDGVASWATWGNDATAGRSFPGGRRTSFRFGMPWRSAGDFRGRLALSSAGRWLAVAPDSTLLLYAMEDGQARRLLNAGWDPWGVGFSADESALVSWSQDRIRVWRPETGVQTFDISLDSIRAVSINANGTLLGAATRDGMVRLWDLTPAPELPTYSWKDLVVFMRSRTSACLTPTQRSSLLLETDTQAHGRYEACEHSYGRTPRR